MSATASSRDTSPSESNQYWAATWLSPTSPTASRRAREPSRPASAVTAAATVSMQRARAPSDHGRRLGLAAQVRLEHEPVGLPVAGDEVEVGRHRRGHPLPVVRGAADRVADPVHQVVRAGREQGPIQLELAGKVLVEHGLADPGTLGDVVHSGGVVALGGEHVASGDEELGTPGAAGQAYSAGRCLGHCRSLPSVGCVATARGGGHSPYRGPLPSPSASWRPVRKHKSGDGGRGTRK